MLHFFNPKVVQIVGSIEKAVILNSLSHWIDKNIKNDKHFIEGNYWTYNSSRAFEEQFPYMEASSIRRYLRQLEEDGFIKSNNFNKHLYDKTKWYCLSLHQDALLEALEIKEALFYAIGQNAQGSGQNAQPIPYNITDNAGLTPIGVSPITEISQIKENSNVENPDVPVVFSLGENTNNISLPTSDTNNKLPIVGSEGTPKINPPKIVPSWDEVEKEFGYKNLMKKIHEFMLEDIFKDKTDLKSMKKYYDHIIRGFTLVYNIPEGRLSDYADFILEEMDACRIHFSIRNEVIRSYTGRLNHWIPNTKSYSKCKHLLPKN